MCANMYQIKKQKQKQVGIKWESRARYSLAVTRTQPFVRVRGLWGIRDMKKIPPSILIRLRYGEYSLYPQ